MITNTGFAIFFFFQVSRGGFAALPVRVFGMFLPLLLLRYYDGTRGTDRPWGKWLFYLFYPAHLLLLGLLAHILL